MSQFGPVVCVWEVWKGHACYFSEERFWPKIQIRGPRTRILGLYWLLTLEPSKSTFLVSFLAPLHSSITGFLDFSRLFSRKTCFYFAKTYHFWNFWIPFWHFVVSKEFSGFSIMFPSIIVERQILKSYKMVFSRK